MVSGNETTKNKGYDSPHYIAAVVEYYPNLGSNPLQSIQNNLPIYEDIIHHASQYVSIIYVIYYIVYNTCIAVSCIRFKQLIIIFCLVVWILSF